MHFHYESSFSSLVVISKSTCVISGNCFYIHKTAKVQTKKIGNNETIKCGYKKHSQSLSRFCKFCYSKSIGWMLVDKLFKKGKNLFVSKNKIDYIVVNN